MTTTMQMNPSGHSLPGDSVGSVNNGHNTEVAGIRESISSAQREWCNCQSDFVFPSIIGSNEFK
jgi:hypothetical protein